MHFPSFCMLMPNRVILSCFFFVCFAAVAAGSGQIFRAEATRNRTKAHPTRQNTKHTRKIRSRSEPKPHQNAADSPKRQNTKHTRKMRSRNDPKPHQNAPDSPKHFLFLLPLPPAPARFSQKFVDGGIISRKSRGIVHVSPDPFAISCICCSRHPRKLAYSV